MRRPTLDSHAEAITATSAPPHLLVSKSRRTMVIASGNMARLATGACLVIAGAGLAAAGEGNEPATASPSAAQQRTAAPVPLAVPVHPRPGTAPAPVVSEAVKFTAADEGRTVTVQMGRTFEFSLPNGRAGAGWERSTITGTSVADANPTRRNACDQFMAEKPPAADATVGTYTFRYKAVSPGTSKIRVVQVTPGGPVPKPQTATQVLGEFMLTVDVKRGGAPDEAAARRVVAEYLVESSSGSLTTQAIAFIKVENDEANGRWVVYYELPGWSPQLKSMGINLWVDKQTGQIVKQPGRL